MPETINLERSYVQAVLSWLDARLERDVRRWQIAGQDPGDRFRGLYVSDAKALELVRRGVGTQWGAGIELPEKETKQLEKQEADALECMQALEESVKASGETLRLKAVQDIFGLSDFEWKAFLVCLAPALDLRYERIYGYLQDDVTRTFASVDLLLSLLVPEGLFRLQYLPLFDRHEKLRTFRLIVPVEENGKSGSALRQAFRVEQGLVNWLLGAYAPSEALGDGAVLFPIEEEDDQSGAAEIFSLPKMPDRRILVSVEPMLSLYGPDSLQQELTARQIATALERSLLKVKISADDVQTEAMEKLYPAVRDARLMNALLYIEGCDAFIDSDSCLLSEAFHALNLMDDMVIVGSNRAFHFGADMPGNDSPLMSVHFDKLTASERAELWAVLLDGVVEDIPESELLILAGQFNLTSGQIVAAASSAMSSALQKGRNLEPVDLFEAARLHSGHHLAELARKIEPRYEWEDLVLPETPTRMLMEMVSMVQSRPQVLEGWGLGRKLTAGAGVSALFSGDPGTGKTLAAQIMAHELGIDLYRIDLSTVVSKYIGETEKNLEKIFREASESNAILFFDEADSIFGKRSEVKDAHDRYANIEVGYLLQRMEDYSGVAILATNLRANLDEAFTRRLQFIINFPFPDEAYRQRIWKVLMPPDLPVAEDLDFGLMADRFKVAGGSIRNIIVSAAYLAAADGGVVTMDHLMHGTRREYQKMGRLLHDADFSLASSKGE